MEFHCVEIINKQKTKFDFDYWQVAEARIHAMPQKNFRDPNHTL